MKKKRNRGRANQKCERKKREHKSGYATSPTLNPRGISFGSGLVTASLVASLDPSIAFLRPAPTELEEE